jgi:hypothetical protein
MFDAGRPDQRKRPGSLCLNFSRAIRGREIRPVSTGNLAGFSGRVI